jgi:hypothetical protein
MTWEQKLAALQALGDCSLRMREPGDWYVCDHIEIGGNGFLLSPTCGETTPEKAVETVWAQYVTNLPSDRHLVINAGAINRRHVRWNGYMWKDLPVGKEG